MSDLRKTDDLNQPLQESDDSALFIFCPADIVYDLSISSEAVRVYLIISGFFRKSGYAFASNKWIAERLGVLERRVQDHLNELERSGYIIRETFQNGLRKVRRIWHPTSYGKYKSNNVCDTVKNDRIDTVKNDCSDTVKNDRIIDISNINTITSPSPSSFANAHYEGYSPKGEKAPPPSNSKGKKEKNPPTVERFGEHVKMTAEQYERLCTEMGSKVVDHYIEHINLWVPNNKPYKDYAAAIRTWEKRDKEKGKQIIDPRKLSQLKAMNEAFARKVDSCLRTQSRIPASIQRDKNGEAKVWLVCPVKDLNVSISLIMEEEEFKRLLSLKMQLAGFDTTSPQTGYIPVGSKVVNQQV